VKYLVLIWVPLKVMSEGIAPGIRYTRYVLVLATAWSLRGTLIAGMDDAAQATKAFKEPGRSAGATQKWAKKQAFLNAPYLELAIKIGATCSHREEVRSTHPLPLIR